MPENPLLKAVTLLKSSLKGHEKAAPLLEQLEDIIVSLPPRAESQKKFPLPEEVARAQGMALFSDGACRGNPGPGAWGILGQGPAGEWVFTSSGVDTKTTNNRMELSGAIEALKASQQHFLSKGKVYPLWLYSDSRYLIDGMTRWLPRWKKKGWKKKDGTPPDNLDLWIELDTLASLFKRLAWVWIKGHAGHPQNEYCDTMANNALDEVGL